MSREEPPPPETVGGFRVLRRLGGGGMGAVFEGEEPNIQRRVAIKILRARLADDPNFVERFQNEARLANAVEHPAIVDVFSFGRLEDGRPYFVMPLLEGASVRELLDREHRLAPERAWSIAREVAAALAAAHGADLIHRDLKPDNVFLERKGEHERVRVMDFGIAKSLGGNAEAGTPKTQTGLLLGTPAYMAPEQWWGAKLDARVDQYAFGAMLFEMLSGEPPFDPAHESGVMKLHLHAEPPTLDSRGLDVPPAVEALLRRLLAKEPGERFGSMTDVIAAGDTAFTNVAREADVATAPTELAPARATPQRESSEQPKAASQRLRRRWLWAHAVCVIATLAVMGGVGYAGPGRRNPALWFVISGFMAYPVVLVFLLAAVLLPWRGLGRDRDRDRRIGVSALALGLGPGLIGAMGTYMGWEIVTKAVASNATSKAFEIFNEGSWEAGANRFMGFGLASALTLSLAFGVALGAKPVAAEPSQRRLGPALAVAVLAFAAIAVALGAPSVVYVAVATALIVLMGRLLPIETGNASAETERTVLSAFALFFASEAALERIAARQAVLWTVDLTRAERVQEIMAAQLEHNATSVAILFAVVILLLLQGSRLRDAKDLGALLRRHWMLGVVLLAVVASDSYLAGKFRAAGAATREALAAQFALFAELDPPSAEALPASNFAPSRGAALQVTRTAVAIDGHEVTRLNTISTPEGRRRVQDALFDALARASNAPLSCLVDRRIAWSDLGELLALARLAGATDAELLFTRGPPPAMPQRGPPEVSWVKPSDFVAVRVSLGSKGLELAPAKAFGEIAGDLLSEARAGRQPALRVADLRATGAVRDTGR